MDKFSTKQATLLIVITVLGILSSVLLHKPLVIGILPGLLFLIGYCIKKGILLKDLLSVSLKGLGRVKIVVFILIFISFLLPSWYLSGTITTMVSLTIKAIDPHHFFIFCFIATMFFSMILGSSIGTLSSIGVPLISASILLKLPVEVTAGAVISGAFVGDRTSPFSSAHQLLANTLELTVKKQGKAMLLTTVIAIILTIFFFGFMDFHFGNGIATSLPTNFKTVKNISFIQFVPPILLVSLVLVRINIIFSYLVSILSGCVIALYHGKAFLAITHALWNGIDGIGGGLINMYELILFIAIAGIYNALLEELNVIQPLLDRWLDSSNSLFSDTVKTMIATFIISGIAANQTMPIIMTGRSFLPHWATHYSNEELARVMGDTTLLLPALIPWNVLAIMSSTVINVHLTTYLPYAIFLWFLPCLTIAVSMYKKPKNFESKIEVSS